MDTKLEKELQKSLDLACKSFKQLVDKIGSRFNLEIGFEIQWFYQEKGEDKSDV